MQRGFPELGRFFLISFLFGLTLVAQTLWIEMYSQCSKVSVHQSDHADRPHYTFPTRLTLRYIARRVSAASLELQATSFTLQYLWSALFFMEPRASLHLAHHLIRRLRCNSLNPLFLKTSVAILGWHDLLIHEDGEPLVMGMDALMHVCMFLKSHAAPVTRDA